MGVPSFNIFFPFGCSLKPQKMGTLQQRLTLQIPNHQSKPPAKGHMTQAGSFQTQDTGNSAWQPGVELKHRKIISGPVGSPAKQALHFLLLVENVCQARAPVTSYIPIQLKHLNQYDFDRQQAGILYNLPTTYVQNKWFSSMQSWVLLKAAAGFPWV